ncbi:MAG: STAS domain-containing protein [Tannerellaceae bacterium]|jgi:anti-anti-sigma factor|nr:STAS domain-containing protein [Tannerellaceae bacterium]
MEKMEITVTEKDDRTVIKISGRLDIVSSVEFEKSVNSLFESGVRNILVDCSDMEYTSSAGLRVFLLMRKRIESNKGKLILKALKPEVESVFRMVGFLSMFDLEA